ncbi:ribosome biogenesis protein TSR3 isoform X1, partial [Aphis craccivora]
MRRTGPPGWGFSAGLTPLPSKNSYVQGLININMPRIRGAWDNKTGNWKNGLLFGTWNVRTLFKPGAAQNIVKEIEKYKLKIVALQEIRWDDTGTLDIQETTILYGKCNER